MHIIKAAYILAKEFGKAKEYLENELSDFCSNHLDTCEDSEIWLDISDAKEAGIEDVLEDLVTEKMLTESEKEEIDHKSVDIIIFY